MHHDKILLFGGSGFIGRQLAFSLANKGCQVTVPCRRPHRHRALLVHPNIKVLKSNIFDKTELDGLCQGQNAIINLVGILNETKTGDFRRVHVDFIKLILSASDRNGIKRLLHLSALGADQARGTSLYLRSKGEGENLLYTFGQKDFQVTSFQPSVVFGAGDQFINLFAGVLKMCPGFFPLACPNSQFAPVYVNDLVSTIVDAVDDRDTYGKHYPICGPEVFTLREILELIKQSLGLSCYIIPLSNGLSKLQALVMQNLPGKLLTMDNYRSLQTPSICKNCQPCTTSFSHYIKNINALYSHKKNYNDLRQNDTQTNTQSVNSKP